MSFDPNRLAMLYYFGDLQDWKLPNIAMTALEQGYDGHALRKLAFLQNPLEQDIHPGDVDSAFQEMGVSAPIQKDAARLGLAKESATQAINGEMNIFDAATHIRIHLCELQNSTPELHQIVNLSQEACTAPRSKWLELETQLTKAMHDLLKDEH
jgi:hypothetical protein